MCYKFPRAELLVHDIALLLYCSRDDSKEYTGIWRDVLLYIPSSAESLHPPPSSNSSLNPLAGGLYNKPRHNFRIQYRGILALNCNDWMTRTPSYYTLWNCFDTSCRRQYCGQCSAKPPNTNSAAPPIDSTKCKSCFSAQTQVSMLYKE